MSTDVIHDIPARRFSAEVEGHRAVLDYALRGRVMTITHTGVPEPLRGRGIAGELTRAALQAARREGWKVVPACSYAAAFVHRHPEFADLLH